MRKIIKPALLLTTIFSLLSCGSSSGDENVMKLKIWAPIEEQPVLLAMANTYKEAHPEYNIQFDFRVMSMDLAINALRQDATTAADVFMYPSGGIPELTSAGLVLPITLGAEQIRAIHTENAITSVTKDDYLYGVPVTPNSFFLYYNKSLFDEDDVTSLNTMMEKDLGAGKHNFSMRLTDSWYLSSFFLTVGNHLFGENGLDPNYVDFNNDLGVAATRYLLELNNNPTFLNDEGEGGNYMMESKLGAIVSGTWSAPGLKERLDDDYAATKLPSVTIDGTTYQMKNFIDYKAYGVNSATKYPQQALEFASWLSNENAQMYRFETYEEAPTVTSLLNHPLVLANQEIAALLSQSDYGINQPPIPQLKQFWDPMSAFGTDLVNGHINESNIVSKLNALVNAIKEG